jgi:hypothetical protein
MAEVGGRLGRQTVVVDDRTATGQRMVGEASIWGKKLIHTQKAQNEITIPRLAPYLCSYIATYLARATSSVFERFFPLDWDSVSTKERIVAGRSKIKRDNQLLRSGQTQQRRCEPRDEAGWRYNNTRRALGQSPSSQAKWKLVYGMCFHFSRWNW